MNSEDHLLKAHRALASARLLFDDGDMEGACNRAYYAMFDAARAALLFQSPVLDPMKARSHRGLIAEFGNRLVKTTLVSAELGRALNQVERIRLLADYTGEGIDHKKTQWAIEKAEMFVQTLDKLVSGSNGEF